MTSASLPVPERVQALESALSERILVLDGAMGTMIQQRQLTASDFGGDDLEGCNENLVRTRPDVIGDIHRAYLEAGADIIETNSFGSTAIVLAEYGLENDARELNLAAAQLARQAAEAFSKPARPRFVAGSMGPTTKAITVTGGITFEQLTVAFRDQAQALVEGGADLLLVETCQDTRNIKAALVGIERAARILERKIPVMVSGTIELMGTMLAGQTAEALWVSLEHADLLSIGLNCGSGPEFMTDHLRTLHTLSHRYVSCYPNAGLPNEDNQYLETPAMMARQMERFVEQGWLNILGGCCGTSPGHIRALAEMVQGKTPRRPPQPAHRAFFSGVEVIEADESTRPLIVGERTNVVGSRLFKQMIAEEKWEEATDIARRQVRGGAHIVDVCLQSTEREEAKDIPLFYEKLIRKIKVPIMIDTTDPAAVEQSLTYCQGKSIINSVNLEDGEEKFERIAPLAKRYGAALVVGCIDEDPLQAQAFTRERKLDVAKRSARLLTGKYRIPAHDLVIDPLVFPCATGDENYIGGAVETIAGLQLIKEQIPYVKTILGISNVSFGLPAAAREVVNSVFLYHCTRAGLDLAIVNAEKIERFASIPEKERKLAEALLFNAPPEAVPADHPQAGLLRQAPADWRDQSREQKIAVNQFHIAAVAEHFRAPRAGRQTAAADLPLDQRLARYIVEGTKDGLTADLQLKLNEGAAPLDIINGPLMTGMAEVGRLFNNNELIVAEVLQSAEAMKAAVSFLEPFMEKSQSGAKGRVLLATVKGDVHDIGKNLVDIILSNNGYQVINLGIKVPPEALIEAYHREKPDAIGLSGLLVKSAGQMVVTAGDLRNAGIETPMLVGGAALSERFTRLRIAAQYGGLVCYAKDAMSGLALMNDIMKPEARPALLERHQPLQASAEEAAAAVAAAASPMPETRSAKVAADLPIPAVSTLERQILNETPLDEVWSYINPSMLYRHHLGFKGNFEMMLSEGDPKARELYAQVEAIKSEVRQFLRVRAVWQFFEAEPEGNRIHLFAPGQKQPLHTFTFERQRREDGLCLADYVLPPRDGRRDHLALLVATAGQGVREFAERAKVEGRYVLSHGSQALALETAEAATEWLHRRIRELWGFPDPESMTMKERQTSRYRGKRYSFGYPACPNLADQVGLWKLLTPGDIGVELTEGFMMEPEASTSAMVFHHPACSYFSVSDEAAGRGISRGA